MVQNKEKDRNCIMWHEREWNSRLPWSWGDRWV